MLENERVVIQSRQEENIKAVPDVIAEKTATEIKVPKKYQDNIKPKSVIRKSFLSFSNDRH